MGIGTALMRDMLELLKNKGYKKTSLSVQKANHAVRMYRKVGFEVIDENEEAYVSLTDIAKYKNPDNAFIVVAS